MWTVSDTYLSNNIIFQRVISPGWACWQQLHILPFLNRARKTITMKSFPCITNVLRRCDTTKTFWTGRKSLSTDGSHCCLKEVSIPTYSYKLPTRHDWLDEVGYWCKQVQSNKTIISETKLNVSDIKGFNTTQLYSPIKLEIHDTPIPNFQILNCCRPACTCNQLSTIFWSKGSPTKFRTL